MKFPWKKLFRSGYDYKNPHDAGWYAKHEAKSTRTKLKNYLKKILHENS